ncbi:YncE family protein [Parasphingorhabdus sp.]|uniref:Vgb family protein n=1 Tax=Parasphingorhabdus sp. TaxID=2709688 RepID=UPI003A90023E
MNRSFAFTLLFVAACSPAMQKSANYTEQALDVPGFADFLAVDGDTVWTTNDGRVEQWSTDGKLASVAIPRPCGTMAVASDSLWVANCEGGNLYRINIETAEVDKIIPTGIANPKGETNVVAGAGSIWVPSDADGKISRIDPETNAVVAAIDVVPGTFFLAFGYDALWAVSSDKQLLQRVDTATNSVTGTAELGKQPGFLAAGEGGVWVQEQGDGTVARIDPDTVVLAGRTKVGDNLVYGDIDVGGGKVWLRTTDDQTFVVIDAKTMEILTRAGDAAGSGALRYTPSGIWTSAHDVQTLSWWTDTDSVAE